MVQPWFSPLISFINSRHQILSVILKSKQNMKFLTLLFSLSMLDIFLRQNVFVSSLLNIIGNCFQIYHFIHLNLLQLKEFVESQQKVKRSLSQFMWFTKPVAHCYISLCFSLTILDIFAQNSSFISFYIKGSEWEYS